jgi:hypothetical protein
MGKKKAKTKRAAKRGGRTAAAKRPAKRVQKRRSATPRVAAQPARAFRFTAADVVTIRFKGEAKPERFRVDDMVEATLAAQDGQTRNYYQYRLVSNDEQTADGSERHVWVLDPKPVGASDPIGPSLWRPASEQSTDGHDVVKACSGNYSTKSVTSYDGSGALHTVKLSNAPAYRMRLELNGKHEFCESVPVTIRAGDVLSAG